MEIWNEFAQNGFVVIPAVVNATVIKQLVSAVESFVTSAPAGNRGIYAIRNLLETLPAARVLAKSPPIRSVVERVCGPGVFAVRGLMFDKTPEANWKVTWHQDLTIAVKHEVPVPGFGPWSVKAGTTHVQPPVDLLERMVTLRLHLDDCDLENGPLQVLPGSHRADRLDAESIQAWRDRVTAISCLAKSGDILLMRPLLLHASSAATKPGHRRVLHLEFAAEQLPGGLEWLSSH